jgi:hypothetical protein
MHKYFLIHKNVYLFSWHFFWGGGYFSQHIFFNTEGKWHLFCLETFHFLNVLIAQQEGIAVFLQ